MIEEKASFNYYLPFYKYTDLGNWKYFKGLIFIRFLMALFCTKNYIHPDEYWQSTEVAYNMVYGGVYLPWEWEKENGLRNTLYPFYLSLFVRIVDFFCLDFAFVIRASYYIGHWILVVIGDHYYFKGGKLLFGEEVTRISLYFYLGNSFFTALYIKCFGNSVETILSIIIIYYLLQTKSEFNVNFSVMTFLVVISFMIRCTSIIGFVPIVLIKLVEDRSLYAYIKAACFIAIPTFVLLITIDSYYYETFTFVPLNFLMKNIVENISA